LRRAISQIAGLGADGHEIGFLIAGAAVLTALACGITRPAALVGRRRRGFKSPTDHVQSGMPA